MYRSLSASFFTSALVVFLAVSSHKSVAAPAHFWLSDEGVSPAGPNVATEISIEEGTIGKLYIWGRPETGKKLRNISLNLVALQAGVDFIDNTITVYNDAGQGIERYEYTSDASSVPAVVSKKSFFNVATLGQTDSIESLQGFSLSDSSPSVKGVGNQCVDAETGCVLASDGLPAWLIASVDYNAIIGGPKTSVHLQIGEHGIQHESLVSGDYDLNGVVDTDDFDEVQSDFSSTSNLWADGNGNGRIDAADYTIWQDNLGSVSASEAGSLTSVRFGADKLNGMDEPIYNAVTDREVTLNKDDADAIITMTAAAPIQAVPEPSSLSFLGLFTILKLCVRRRRCFSLR